MWADNGFRRWARIGVLVLAMFVLANCASAPENDPEALAEYNTINDPIEPINRGAFEFNLFLDRALFRPVTAFYRTIAPETVREFIHNFLQNLRTPVILANDLLQGEPSRGGTTSMRFLINTTIGVVGFGDPATSMGFEQHDEDFGQTLAVWGAGEGPYLMIPIFGPSNPRDAVGKVVDFFLDPINWWAPSEGLDSVLWGRTVMTGIDTRTTVLGHVQRGGEPASTDRVLATVMGTTAVELAMAGSFNRLVTLEDGSINSQDIALAASGQRLVPLDHRLITAARAVHTCFGD